MRSSPIEFYGFSDSDQIVVVQNCTFDEVSAKKNSTSSVLKSGSLLSFNGTNVQLYSCNFTRIKGYSQSMRCSEGNITMMNVVVSGIEGDLMITKDCNVHMTNNHFADNNGSRLISVGDGNLTMENSQFFNNTSKYNGIVYLNNSEAHLINSSISENKGNWAGGIDLIDSSVEMVSCILSGNRGFAGGIHLKRSSVRVINSTFSGNQGERIGGIDVYKSEANVTNSTFTGNKGIWAAGINLNDGQAHVNNCTFTENMGRYAGGVNLYRGKARVSNCTFTGNKGRDAGGINVLQYSKAHVINNTFTENKGERTGGIDLSNSEAQVINSTLTGNQGEEAGALQLRSFSRVTTGRCLFLENIAIDKGGAVNVNSKGEYQDSNSVFADNVAGNGGKIFGKGRTVWSICDISPYVPLYPWWDISLRGIREQKCEKIFEN